MLAQRAERAREAEEVVGPDSFRFVREIGSGAFGQVFEVAHRHTRESFAMKVFKKSTVNKANLLRYTLTERRVLAEVQHPYIVSLCYAFQTSSYLVLVMELCAQGDLHRLLKRERRLPDTVATLFTAELLLALCHLHSRRILYRDLKPANVVVDDEGHAKLVDFGLSKEAAEGLYSSRSFCGSIAFIAPEILLRKSHGHTVDIYGLGVLLFTMLVGKPPFWSNDKLTLVLNIRSAPLEIPEGVTGDAASFIMRTMERRPAKRLGADGTDKVQRHPLFLDLSFEALLARKLPSDLWLTCLRRLPAAGRGKDPFESACSSAAEVSGWDYGPRSVR